MERVCVWRSLHACLHSDWVQLQNGQGTYNQCRPPAPSSNLSIGIGPSGPKNGGYPPGHLLGIWAPLPGPLLDLRGHAMTGVEERR